VSESLARATLNTVPRHTVVGLDIGGTKIAVVEGTAQGAILQRAEIPTRPDRPFREVWPGIAELTDATIEYARARGRQVVALSVAVGGPLHIREGVLGEPPHLPGWHNIDLRSYLTQRFPSLPIFVEHDGNAGALAEFHFGAGRLRSGLQHLIFLTFGTGLGAGLIVNGSIVHGASDTAGEVGHWRLAIDGPIAYGKSGTWEAYGSGTGLLQLARTMYPDRWTDVTSIRNLVDQILSDDMEALSVAAEAGRRMGHGMAMLIDAFNPEVLVVGSLGVALGERVLSTARAVVTAEALPQAAAACEILPAVLGSRVGDTAALMAALVEPLVRQSLRSETSP
jgi:glucokinase